MANVRSFYLPSMDETLAQKAIRLALEGNWEEALATNSDILKITPEDTDALNRLARAYAELGEITKARSTAQKVLKFDPVNSIAQKCIKKWKSLDRVDKSTFSAIASDSFLEESGKTKLISLLHLGDEMVFANLDPGEEVKIFPHAHRVSIITDSGKYIGRLPDDLAARLRNLIKFGNKYQALIKSVSPKEVTVFIRELSRGKGAANTPSFPPEKIDYVSFTPPELIHMDKPIAIGEDLEES